MVLSVGEYEVKYTGTVITFRDEPITFNIASDFVVRMVFQDDSSKSEPELQTNIVNGNQLDLLLINFNHPLGIGNVSPIDVGDNDGQKMYFNFIIYQLNHSESKLVHYTWYAREFLNNKI